MLENTTKNTEKKDNSFIEISGLWEGKTKAGDVYLSGYMGSAKIMIFRNTYKDKENQPDYKLFVTKNEKQNSGTLKEKDGVLTREKNAPF